MSEIKKWSIKQVINGVVYFNQSFYATEKDYLAFKNILLLPKNGFFDKDVKFVKTIVIFDKKEKTKTYFRRCVFDKSFYKGCKSLSVLDGRVYNGVRVDNIYCYYGYFPNDKLPNIIKQGKEFEYYVSNYFREQGYEVINNFEKNEKDEGIDIIAKKGNDELLLIQCKNWEIPVISHKEIKEFLGNCYLFLYNHKEYRKFKKVRRLYITSNSNLDKSAKYLLKENYPFVEYIQIPFKKEKK